MQDMTIYGTVHCYENSDREYSKYKNMGNLLVFLDVLPH
jgi:hypothetical protein